MEYLTFIFWYLAAFLSAVQDIIKFRFTESVFHSKFFLHRPALFVWLRSWSRDRYVDSDQKAGVLKKLFLFIPIPDQVADAWHLAKWVKLFFFFSSLISFSLYNTVPKNLAEIFIIGLKFGAINWFGFTFSYFVILRRPKYRQNPFKWFSQFFKNNVTMKRIF